MEPEEAILRRKVKAELRKRLRAVRHTAPLDACAGRSEKIVASLASMAALESATTVALFWPIVERHEVDLRALDGALRRRGVRVVYPSIHEVTRDMTFRVVTDVSLLAERGLGFEEPPPDAPECTKGDIDVIVVPAIALDPRGHRIGYGAGLYDRTLPIFAPPAVTVGVAYDYQLLADIPNDDTDVPLDWIVTDSRVLAAAR